MRPKFMLFIICVETAIICFFIFGFYLHINRFKPKFQPVFAHRFSNRVVFDTFNLDSQQKEKYNKILKKFYTEQMNNEKEKRKNFPILHNLISEPNSSNEEIEKYKEKQVEIFEKEISNSTDYLVGLKSILNKNQKELFCDLLKNKEMHKIMPPVNIDNPEKLHKEKVREPAPHFYMNKNKRNKKMHKRMDYENFDNSTGAHKFNADEPMPHPYIDKDKTHKDLSD